MLAGSSRPTSSVSNIAVLTPIPLITKTGPTIAHQLIAITRQHSHPEQTTDICSTVSSTRQTDHSSWSGVNNSCLACCQYARSTAQDKSPKRISSVTDDFATIAADS